MRLQFGKKTNDVVEVTLEGHDQQILIGTIRNASEDTEFGPMQGWAFEPAQDFARWNTEEIKRFKLKDVKAEVERRICDALTETHIRPVGVEGVA